MWNPLRSSYLKIMPVVTAQIQNKSRNRKEGWKRLFHVHSAEFHFLLSTKFFCNKSNCTLSIWWQEIYIHHTFEFIALVPKDKFQSNQLAHLLLESHSEEPVSEILGIVFRNFCKGNQVHRTWFQNFWDQIIFSKITK